MGRSSVDRDSKAFGLIVDLHGVDDSVDMTPEQYSAFYGNRLSNRFGSIGAGG